MKEAERTYLMKQNFMGLHQSGLYIAEIANKYQLSTATVYRHLQEIADANGVSRASLLKVVRTPTERQYREEEEKVKVTVGEIQSAFNTLYTGIRDLITKIDTILEEEKEENEC